MNRLGFLVSGRMVLHIDGKAHEAKPGDSWTIPKDVIHRAQTLEDSVAIEVFFSGAGGLSESVKAFFVQGLHILQDLNPWAMASSLSVNSTVHFLPLAKLQVML